MDTDINQTPEPAKTRDPASGEHTSLRRSTIVLFAGFGLIIVLMSSVLWFGLSFIGDSQQVLSTVVEKNLTKANIFSEMKRISQGRTIALLAMAGLDDPFERDEYNMQFSALAGEFIEQRLALEELSTDNAGSDNTFKDETGLIKQSVKIQKSLANALLDDSNTINTKALSIQSIEAQQRVHLALSRLAEQELKAGFIELDTARKHYNQAKYGLIAISLIAITIGLATLLTVVRIIRRGEYVLRRQAESLRTNFRELERTSALEKQAIALEKQNDTLSQFAYIASHDLQEPLRTVINYMQLLSKKYKGKLDSKADKCINYAVDGAARMQVMINALLGYARVDTSTNPSEPVNGHDVINDALSDLSALIEENGANITVQDMPVFQADPVQLRQLFQNIIGNALKYRGKLNPVINVKTEALKGLCKVSIDDNGIGIPKASYEKVFEVFKRVHGTDESEYKGTGIGLAICKKIVERHGGQIWVEPNQPNGSCFCFTIPYNAMESAA